MANTLAPQGFQFTRNYLHAAPTYQTTQAQILNSNSNTFGKGDVVLISGGYIDKAASNSAGFFGVFEYCQYYDTAQQKTIFSNSWNAPSTALAGSVIASVITDPYAVFSVQSNASSGAAAAVTQANIGKNATFGGNGAPTTGTGISTAYLDTVGIATTNTGLQFRIVALGQGLNNDNTSPNNYVDVIFTPGLWQSTNATGA